MQVSEQAIGAILFVSVETLSTTRVSANTRIMSISSPFRPPARGGGASIK